ncbi:MAG: hypothetical protein ACYC90_04420 [Candidatus Nanopelagicales bacterium]
MADQEFLARAEALARGVRWRPNDVAARRRAIERGVGQSLVTLPAVGLRGWDGWLCEVCLRMPLEGIPLESIPLSMPDARPSMSAAPAGRSGVAPPTSPARRGPTAAARSARRARASAWTPRCPTGRAPGSA